MSSIDSGPSNNTNDQLYHNGQIDQHYNYDNLFFRIVSISLGKTLTKSIRYIDRFEDKKIRVLVPFYYHYRSERFALDTFVDDTLGKRVEIDTTQIPRGIMRINSWRPVTSEFANPNQFLSQKANINNELRNVVSKVRAIPVQITYNVEIFLATQADVEKVMQKLLDSTPIANFFRIEYYGIAIDSFFSLPDDPDIQINSDKMDFQQEDTKTKITLTLNVRSYYPAFRIDVDDLEVCDNDDEIDWNMLDIPKPTKDYKEMVRKYHNRYDNYINWNEAFASRVFWKAYAYESQKREDYYKSIGKNNIKEDIQKNDKKRPK